MGKAVNEKGMQMLTLIIDEELILTPISMEYREDIFETFDQDVIEYLLVNQPPAQISETEAFIQHELEQMQQRNDIVWVILYHQQFAGCCGLHDIKSGHPNFGLWIKKGAQNKHIGKRVVHFALNWILENIEQEYIRYRVDQRNVRSIRIIEDFKAQLISDKLPSSDVEFNILEYHVIRQ